MINGRHISHNTERHKTAITKTTDTLPDPLRKDKTQLMHIEINKKSWHTMERHKKQLAHYGKRKTADTLQKILLHYIKTRKQLVYSGKTKADSANQDIYKIL